MPETEQNNPTQPVAQEQHQEQHSSGATNHKHSKRNREVTRNPFIFYRGVLYRFFALYRHVFGLLSGGLIAYVNDLPAYKRKFFRSAGSRMFAWILRPFIKKELRNQPFEVQLRMRLEMLGPTYVKLGQIMAIREDILPRNITDELKQLFDRLPEIPFPAIRDIIEENLDAAVDDLFLEIDEHPLGSASIGQTHLAKLKNGETVVLKVIKPGIRESILLDLKLLQILSSLLEWMIPQYQPRVIINEFCLYTQKEIDLTYEADHAEIFAANFTENADIVFPKIYREYSTRDVLCMQYLDGLKPNDPRIFRYSQEDLDKIVNLGAYAIIKMLYDDGFFHADLHAGNLIILPGPRVGFIDLGMVGRFDTKVKLNMLYYFYSLVNGDIENSSKYLLAMARPGHGGDPAGFRRAVSDLFRRFLLRASGGDLSLAQLIMESVAIGGKYRMFFPVEMTLMVKALVTFEGVGLMLNPELDIPELSRKHIKTVFARHYHPRNLANQILRGIPELVDVIVRLPELISDGTRFIEDSINAPEPENPLAGLRSSLMAGACIIGGVIAYVNQAPELLWGGLFASSVIFYFFSKK